jgi:hypothetical protein
MVAGQKEKQREKKGRRESNVKKAKGRGNR